MQMFLLHPEGVLANPFLDEQQGFCFDGSKHYASNMDTKCYPLLTQEPCKHNEAFVYNHYTNLPECRKTECPEIDYEGTEGRNSYQIMYEGSCAKLLDCCEGGKGKRGFACEEDTPLKEIGTTAKNPNTDCVFEKESIEGRCRACFGSSGYFSANSCKDLNLMYTKILRKCVSSYKTSRVWVESRLI